MAAMLATARIAPAQTAKPAELTGAWHFVMDTGGGDREFEADFKTDGENVTGKYGKADVAGTFKEGKLALSFTIESEEAGSGTLKLNGVLEGDAITGDWGFGDYTGTFKATRKPSGTATAPPGL